MRKAFTASAFALFGLMVGTADAMPFPTLNDGLSGATSVAFGCGPGWTRGPYGGCHPMGGYGYGYGALCMALTAITPTSMATVIIHTPTDTATIAPISFWIGKVAGTIPR